MPCVLDAIKGGDFPCASLLPQFQMHVVGSPIRARHRQGDVSPSLLQEWGNTYFLFSSYKLLHRSRCTLRMLRNALTGAWHDGASRWTCIPSPRRTPHYIEQIVLQYKV